MVRVVTTLTRTPPDETDWLCEGCGYVLNGLPAGGRCPECGKPTAESEPELRSPPLWERPEAGSTPARFVRTTAQLLFRPQAFYRSLSTRGRRADSRSFALVNWAIVSVLFGLAGALHLDWFLNLRPELHLGVVFWMYFAVAATAAFIVLLLSTRVAARLTSLEAGYRGLRLPLNVVLRGLDYHAAHYLPVALLTAGTVVAYRLLALTRPTFAAEHGDVYLYALCGEVVIFAAYLFKTYWIGMRNMMYASR